jgi:lipopolysaccharide heptosyltransferase I
VNRLLVVRLGSLGDLVHTLPAVAALRRAHPSLEIDWLVDAMHREFLALVPVVTSVVALPGRTVGAWLDTRRRLRGRNYDVAADFQGLIKSAALARLSGARDVVGFDRLSLRESAARFFYTGTVNVGGTGHVVFKNLRLAASLGAADGPLEFPLARVASPAADEVRAQVGEAYALVNPGAAWPNKRWPPDRFGRISSHLADRCGLRSVVLWGPGEAAVADAVVRASSGAAVRAPETGLHDLVAIARGARLIVSGDTGPLHIAAAVGVPVVSVFGPTDPRRNGPWDEADAAISRYDGCACHYQRRCRRGEAGWCLATIAVEEVCAAIDARLRAPRPGAAR